MTSFSATATTNSRAAAGAAAPAFDATLMANLYAGSVKPASRARAAGILTYNRAATAGCAASSGIGDKATTAPCASVEQLARAIGNPVFGALAFKSKVYSRV